MFYEVMNSVQHIFEKSKNGKQGTAAFQILAQLETPHPSFQKDMAWAQSKAQQGVPTHCLDVIRCHQWARILQRLEKAASRQLQLINRERYIGQIKIK